LTRKKVPTKPEFTSWSDVNNAMKLIGQLESSLDELKIDLNREIATAKENADKLSQPINAKISQLEKDIKAYVTQHREELDGKSKKLTFGRTGYRITTKV